MSTHKNIAMLEVVAAALGDMLKEVVFVGGATTALYIDDPAAPSPTPSDDVDCVVQVGSKIEYAKLEKLLRAKGFKDPAPDDEAPICRSIKVDVMPTDEGILGFSNRWYAEAIEKKTTARLPNKTEIFIFSVPYFVATKLVAYNDRGKSDPRFSQDLEDICSILDGCTGIEDQIKQAPSNVRGYIQKELLQLVKDEELFEEVAYGFIRASGDPVGRAKRILAVARTMAIP